VLITAYQRGSTYNNWEAKRAAITQQQHLEKKRSTEQQLASTDVVNLWLNNCGNTSN
jgi:hypothetical protein